ncbi:ribosomal protein L6, alpha-beta domain-containing protein [Spinellus fusiger]|nr:ribosomal protein L6, alpha-beta domain-containing protein [Spinellus fusiger]
MWRLSSTPRALQRLARPLTTSAPVASHIGREPIAYAQEVTLHHETTPITTPRIPSELNSTILTVRGPLGEIKMPIQPFVKFRFTPAAHADAENVLEVGVTNTTIKHEKAMWGTTRALIQNAIVGVSEGYRVQLRLVGVGYRATLENNERTISMKLGYAHLVTIDLPQGVTCTVPQPNRILLSSVNLQQVTEMAAQIQWWRKPEPYNQKGIFINDETIKKKEGKKK